MIYNNIPLFDRNEPDPDAEYRCPCCERMTDYFIVDEHDNIVGCTLCTKEVRAYDPLRD